MITADYFFIVALIFVIAWSLYFAPRIPTDRVAMQWGLDGKPTWHAPKWLALSAIVAVMLTVRLITWAGMTYAPARVQWPEFGISLLSLIAAAVHLYILVRATKSGRP